MKLISGIAVAIVLAAFGISSAAPAMAATRPCVMWAEPTSDRENIIWPEITTTYYSGHIPIPPGGYAEINGEYPHSRFLSFQTSGVNGQNINGWADFQIQPDPGSSNPFLPGADRTVTKRSYTIKVVDKPLPAAGPATNTLYTSTSDGKVRSEPGLALVTLRYYLPDLGTGRLAGVPAPTVTLVTSTGQRILTPTCTDNLGDPGYTQTLAATGTQTSLAPGSGPFLAHRVPVWRKFVNAATGELGAYADNDTFGSSVYPALRPYTLQAPSGFFENIFNKYVATTISMDFGQVLVFRAKLPTVPHTFDGETTMGTGQMRFWSMCTGSAQTTMAYGCVVDEAVPVDDQGYFTIVISTAAARPANATTNCGVAWLPVGPGAQSVAIMRNMLPSPTFTQAIQNVTPGDEIKQMGAYYPEGKYYATTADFEKLGCHRADGESQAQGPSAQGTDRSARRVSHAGRRNRRHHRKHRRHHRRSTQKSTHV